MTYYEDFDPQSYDNLWDMAHAHQPAQAVSSEPTKAQLKAEAYAKAEKRCILKKGHSEISFWTVNGYCPYTLTNGKKQFFKTVETMRKRYLMLIKQGYALVK